MIMSLESIELVLYLESWKVPVESTSGLSLNHNIFNF